MTHGIICTRLRDRRHGQGASRGFLQDKALPASAAGQAAALSAAFLRDITENIALAAREAPITGYIAYAPEGQEALFDGHLAAGTGLLLADGSPLMPPDVQGFGRCLLHAILAMLARGHRSAVVLNSDSPTLPTALLVQTASTLATPGDRVVLGPAEDGGYYLLGMKAAHAHLFADIAWSTERVADTTRLRAAQLGLEVVELPAWYDVDDQAALTRMLAETTAARPRRLPRADCLRCRYGATTIRLMPYPAPIPPGLSPRWGSKAQPRTSPRNDQAGDPRRVAVGVDDGCVVAACARRTGRWLDPVEDMVRRDHRDQRGGLFGGGADGDAPDRDAVWDLDRAAGRGGNAAAADRCAAVSVDRCLSLCLGRAGAGVRGQPLSLHAG